MSGSDSFWEHTANRSEQPREFLLSVEFYVSSVAGLSLRKPTLQRKKFDKRESIKQLTGVLEENQKKLKEKSSWIGLSRGSATAGTWRPAICELSEEGNGCLLNVYVDETLLYQSVSIHQLNHTDIRPADNSLFFRRDCLGIYCAAGQRWSSVHTSEPLYLQFPSPDACNTWLVLLRSYASPEVYGRSAFPADGGLYRIWRQMELTIIQGRNLGNARHFPDTPPNAGLTEDNDSRSGPEVVDLDVSCDIHVNGTLCGRTTVKKGIGSPNWHESFTFSDLPPFETLDITVWREKRLFKPSILGSVRIELSNFRRGEHVEGWFPVIHDTALASGVHVGDVRMKVRVDEEIILPHSEYSNLLQSLISRNFLDWMSDFEGKLHLTTISNPLMSIAIAKDVLIDNICELADREVDGTPHSHNTLFRGNTILTKTMELSMIWYGKAFLEASIGSVIRRLCSEKIAIEVDPVRSGKNGKDIERSVDQLIYWCRELWTQIYNVRGECPREVRRLLEHIRKLVERHYKLKDNPQDNNKELPWQSVSAFCFLRFIVPAILHPHLFGICLPSAAVQRSLTLIAKVIQSLANLNANVQKEEFMRGIRDFIKESLPTMIDYILVVSTPVNDEPYGTFSGAFNNQYDRFKIVNALHERRNSLPVLDKEAIPLLPHVLDIPKQLAVVSSAVMRASKRNPLQPKPRETMDELDKFCAACYDMEEQALHRVSQLAASSESYHHPSSIPSEPQDHPRSHESSSDVPPLPISPLRTRRASSTQTSRRTRKFSRPSTAPSTPGLSLPSPSPAMPSPAMPSSFPHNLNSRKSQSETSDEPFIDDQFRGQGTWSKRRNRLLHPRSPSTDSIPYQTQIVPGAPAVNSIPSRFTDTELSDDAGKRRKGLLRNILTRR